MSKKARKVDVESFVGWESTDGQIVLGSDDKTSLKVHAVLGYDSWQTLLKTVHAHDWRGLYFAWRSQRPIGFDQTANMGTVFVF